MRKKYRIFKKRYKRLMKEINRIDKDATRIDDLKSDVLYEYIRQQLDKPSILPIVVACLSNWVVSGVKCDETNNTPEDRERGIINVDVALNRSVDFIQVSWNRD